MTPHTDTDSGTRAARVLRPAITGALWTSSAFCVVLSVLLCATYVQMRVHDPINSPALAQMMAQAREGSDAEVAEQIRALDLLARKAYFTSRRQLRVGGTLLLIGAAAALLLWTALQSVSPSPVQPPGQAVRSWWEQQSRTRLVVSGVGAVVVLAGLASSVLVQRDAAGRKAGPPSLAPEELQTGWVGFRGFEGNGVAFHDNAPLTWDGAAMKGVAWKVAVPRPGHSSAVVWDGRVFLTGGDAKSREVMCFALSDGALRWRHVVTAPPSGKQPEPKIDEETGYAAPTAACDGHRVFAVFPTGELVALDLDGKVVWSRHLGVPANHYGHSSSLLVDRGLLFVQYDHGAGAVMALDCTTGDVVWQVKRTRLSWSSPICVNTGKRRELVVVDNEVVSSYDPAGGSLLWSVSCMYGEVAPSPAFAAGRVFVATEYSPAAGLDVTSADTASILWRWDGELPSTASPVATAELVFFAASYGMVSCVDAVTGKSVWTHEFGNGFYSSPVISGGRVYLTDRKGTTHVLAVSREYAEVGKGTIGEACVTTPAILDGTLVLRGTKHLYCITGTEED